MEDRGPSYVNTAARVDVDVNDARKILPRLTPLPWQRNLGQNRL